MKGIGYFQNLRILLRNFLEIFWIFWGIFKKDFFGGIYLEEFFGRNFLGRIFLGKNFLGGFFGGDFLGRIFFGGIPWEEFSRN